MYDYSSLKAAELLSYFGKNTAVTLTHNYGNDVVEVRSARTNNVIESIENITALDSVALYILATSIMKNKKFPRNRKMNKAWSPIRFSAASKAMMEEDSGIRFS